MEVEILIPIAMFAAIFGVLYMYFTTRNKERMAMIEKGVDASLFQSPPSKSSYSLKFGMLFVGVAIGILSAYLFAAGMGMNEEVAYPSMIFLFGGLGLIAYHFMAANTEKKNAQDTPTEL